MNIKEFTESVIAIYLEKGGTVHPDITLDIFLLIENNESLLNDYQSLAKHYKEVNPTIGKTIHILSMITKLTYGLKQQKMGIYIVK